jgi:hypothetical protein
LVQAGLAPPIRPDEVLRPEGDEDAQPNPDDLRQLSRDVLGQAEQFIGLTAVAARELADRKHIIVRLIDEDTSVLTADYGFGRLNLCLVQARVVSAFIG